MPKNTKINGRKKTPKGPAFYKRKIIEELHRKPEVRQKLKDSHARLEMLFNPNSPYSEHIANRGYDVYNDHVFGPHLQTFGLGNNIVESLSMLPRRKGADLEILEEGPGKGRFLKQLKQKLNDAGIKSRTTALDMSYHRALLTKQASGHIDNVILKPAELYSPKRKRHVIISGLGPITYTIDELRKNHLKKFAHSLHRGGIMMVGFTTQGLNGLSEHPKPDRKLLMEVEMDGIRRSFSKMGFRARFYQNKVEGQNVPDWVLIVQRTNKPFVKKPVAK